LEHHHGANSNSSRHGGKNGSIVGGARHLHDATKKYDLRSAPAPARRAPMADVRTRRVGTSRVGLRPEILHPPSVPFPPLPCVLAADHSLPNRLLAASEPRDCQSPQSAGLVATPGAATRIVSEETLVAHHNGAAPLRHRHAGKVVVVT